MAQGDSLAPYQGGPVAVMIGDQIVNFASADDAKAYARSMKRGKGGAQATTDLALGLAGGVEALNIRQELRGMRSDRQERARLRRKIKNYIAGVLPPPPEPPPTPQQYADWQDEEWRITDRIDRRRDIILAGIAEAGLVAAGVELAKVFGADWGITDAGGLALAVVGTAYLLDEQDRPRFWGDRYDNRYDD